MRWSYVSARAKLGVALGVSSLGSILFYLTGLWVNEDVSLSYLPWNLMLAWISLFAALWLEHTVHRKIWSSWYALAVTVLWLILLPNAFYMVSDFVHIQGLDTENLLYNTVMFSSFIINSLILGLLSLFIIHFELAKRLPMRIAFTFVGLIILVCSFAIYVGRDLRWNAWDLIANSTSVLFDVSDRLIHPGEHPKMLVTTFSFFVFIASVYGILWYAAKVARNQRSN